MPHSPFWVLDQYSLDDKKNSSYNIVHLILALHHFQPVLVTSDLWNLGFWYFTCLNHAFAHTWLLTLVLSHPWFQFPYT